MQNIRIASPCSADWNRMAGTDRVRFCPECKLNVYNFSEMSESEVQTMMEATAGRLCTRFYQRPDGTMLTRNCPVGFRGALLRVASVASATLSAFIALSHIEPAWAQPRSASPLVQLDTRNYSLTIEVVDPTGAVIPNATISLLDETAGTRVSSLTDQEGKVRLALLPKSSYSVTVSALGFVQRTVAHLQNSAAQSMAVRLEVGVAVMGGPVVFEPSVEPELERAPFPGEMAAPQSTLSPLRASSQQKSPLHRFFLKLRRIF